MSDHEPFWKVITRFGNSSLEVPFLKALVETGNIGENLGFAPKVEWGFRSTAQLKKPTNADRDELEQLFREGVVHFNVGGGVFDQHGRTEPLGLCETCSLDLLRGEYDFLQRRPWLREIYKAVRENDLHGTALSSEKETIRHLMTGCHLLMPGRHEWQLDKMSLAFRAAFSRCKAGVSVNKAMSTHEVKIGAAEVCPEKAGQLTTTIKGAGKCLKEDWDQARQDVRDAEKGLKVTAVWHPVLSPIINRKLRVVELRSDAIQATKATRWCGMDKTTGRFMEAYDLCVVIRSNGTDGHVQVQFNDAKEILTPKPPEDMTIEEMIDFLSQNDLDDSSGLVRAMAQQSPDKAKRLGIEICEALIPRRKSQIVARWRLDLAPVAKALRLAEANFSGRRMEDVDLSKRGWVYDVHGIAIPWYAAEYGALVADGTSSSPDVPKTVIRHDKISEIVVGALPECRLLKEQADGSWQPRISQAVA